MSGVSSGSWNHISLGDITGGLVWSTSSRVLVVVRDGGDLLLLAAGAGRAVHGTIGTGALGSSAVHENGTVVSSASGEVSEGSGDLERVPLSHGLGEVEGLSFHLDVLTEIFIAVHSSGEELVVTHASNSLDIRSGAGGVELDEASGSGLSLVVGEHCVRLRAVWGFS